MNCKKLCLIFLVFIVCSVFRESIINASDEFVETIRDDEALRMAKHLGAWVDKKMIAELSKHSFTDEDIKKLYYDYKNALVTPPNPATYKEYSISDAEGALARTEKMGKIVLNTFMAMSDEALMKYGDLISAMRDQLSFDALHMPLAIKHDNSRDIYWYEIHMQGVKVVDEIFTKTFEANNENTPEHESIIM